MADKPVDDLLARVQTRAESLRNAKRDRAAELRKQHPEFARFVDDVYRHFGGAHAITINGERFGKDPIERVCPPIPGVGNLRVPAKQSGFQSRENRGLRERKPSAYQRALEAFSSAETSDSDGD